MFPAYLVLMCQMSSVHVVLIFHFCLYAPGVGVSHSSCSPSLDLSCLFEPAVYFECFHVHPVLVFLLLPGHLVLFVRICHVHVLCLFCLSYVPVHLVLFFARCCFVRLVCSVDLCFVALLCALLSWSLLFCVKPVCVVLCSFVLCCAVLFCSFLTCVVLLCLVLLCSALLCFALHCSGLFLLVCSVLGCSVLLFSDLFLTVVCCCCSAPF